MDINNIDIKKVAIAVFIVLILSVGISLVQKKYFVPNPTTSPSPTPTINIEEKRDNQRKEDILNISKALDAYVASNNGIFPNTNDIVEKISDENSSAYQTLKNKNFLSKPYKDPLPNNFYGYKSNGYYYELTAVMESKNNKECVMNGKLCIYTIGSYSNYDYDDYSEYDYLE